MEKTRAKAPLGRPRGFDAEEALERAMRVFWEKGYEGAGLSDLTEAMGITRTSMYAAFGNKEALFRKALERYTRGPASYAARAVGETTAREVAEAFLAGAVGATTSPGRPAGCLGVQGALATGEPGRPAREALAAWREDGVTLLRDRFRQAAGAGELPPTADPGTLARYLMTVANGIAVQAAGGAGREALEEVARLAMGAWPS
ncbi:MULTISPECIES: TetR/AcrR family transcriptional regulator [unclassified Streptomyces]|uniref:TetR/AcrR family transcriptional regulator n=1 Tax=Streptomyces sp. NPDC001255 TaxID=3364550 RepID=UPI0036A5F338